MLTKSFLTTPDVTYLYEYSVRNIACKILPLQEEKITTSSTMFSRTALFVFAHVNIAFLGWLCSMFCLQLSAAPLPGVHPPGTGLLHKNSACQVLFFFFFPSCSYERRTNVVISSQPSLQ